MGMLAGYEKFWSALLSGGFVAAINTIILYMASIPGIVDAPDKATISAALTGLVTALAAAFGALIATNSSPTNISVSAEPTPTKET